MATPSRPLRLTLRNVGPIRDADITFGDLTVFVGAQATGKSIALELFNSAVDRDRIVREMIRYGLDWSADPKAFWDLYLGQGLRSVMTGPDVVAKWFGSRASLATAPARRSKSGVAPEPMVREETLFYIPAQRVLTLRDGWPRPFSDYSLSDPYVVKAFSERLRSFLDQGLWAVKDQPLFPLKGRLKADLRDVVRDAIFHDFELHVDTSTLQRRLVLRHGEVEIPYMVWSAGQREFVPLLIGLYWLLPPTKVSRRGNVEWVVIEEPEMGLHPKAILSVMLLVLDLMSRGYRVALSTHSGQILDVLWAIRRMAETTPDPRLLLLALGAPSTTPLINAAKSAFTKRIQTYFFGQDGIVRDISGLDPGSEDAGEAGWGGLSEFSGRLADAVGEAVNRSERP